MGEQKIAFMKLIALLLVNIAMSSLQPLIADGVTGISAVRHSSPTRTIDKRASNKYFQLVICM